MVLNRLKLSAPRNVFLCKNIYFYKMAVSSTVQDVICNFSKVISTNPPKNSVLDILNKNTYMLSCNRHDTLIKY